MFYESIPHVILDFVDPTLAFQYIQSGKANKWEAIQTTINNKTVVMVCDSHIDDNNFSEVALLLKKDGKFYQYESFSKSIVDYTNVADSLATVKINDNYLPTDLLLDIKGTEIADFTCGCCGQRFTGNVAKQLEFDQDCSYGICDKCEDYYS